MDHYRIVHDIVTTADLSSVPSILRVTLDRVMREFQLERAFYVSLGPRGGRCLAARNENASEITDADSHVPWDIIRKVQSSKAPYHVKMPIVPKGQSRASSWNSIRIRSILAVPSCLENAVVGVGYFERKTHLPSFRPEEVGVVCGALHDVEGILNNTRKYAKQTFEIENLKHEIALSKIKMVAQHPSMIRLFNQIQKLAKVPSTVLIQGESGSGKELVARAIYNLSGLKGPFVSINCGGIEANLMKSEIFGHRRGSFSGAHKDRVGLFKQAEGGILFMDEVGDMPPDMQVALLRTLESGEVLPVGADQPELVDTRVIAATHRDLYDSVQEGEFRNDLFQRLKGITLTVPPLRDRPTDIPLLVDYFVAKYNRKLSLGFKSVSPEAMEWLQNQEFSDGNVRELEHMIERAMVFEDDPETITLAYMADASTEGGYHRHGEDGSFESQVNAFARNLIEETIAHCQGNKTQAMKKLGLPRTTFYSMINRYGISLDGGDHDR